MQKNRFITGGVVALLLLVALSCVISGCTGDESPVDTPQATEATNMPANTEPDYSGTDDRDSETGAVHYSKLEPYLPDMTGEWISREVDGTTLTTSEGSWSLVSREYTQMTDDSVVVTVVIQDTAEMMGVGYWQMWDSMVTIDTTEMSWKSTTVDGYPAWVMHDKIEKEYIEYVNVDGRFFVFIDAENAKEDYLTTFNNAIDFGGIASLG